jgi:hypothetical protein
MAERRIETGIQIDAPARRVWALLTDSARFPDWNPFIMRFKPTVLTVHPERELRWKGKLLIPGIFDGEHYFLLDPIGESRTHLTHGENFSGFLITALSATLSATEGGFNAVNVASKQQAEQNEAQKNAPRP